MAGGLKFDDLQWSLQSQTVLWFCDSLILTIHFSENQDLLKEPPKYGMMKKLLE